MTSLWPTIFEQRKLFNILLVWERYSKPTELLRLINYQLVLPPVHYRL